MLYIKSIPDPKIKLLFVMGATWHTKCMFDLDTVEDSFADMLHTGGLGVYAADLFGSGPGPKPDYIGDRYCENLEYLSEKIKEFDINCIMGYSAGCTVVKDLATQFNFKSIVLLDPASKLKMAKQLINDDKYIINKLAVAQALIDNGATVDPVIAQDYINAITTEAELVTASYPVRYLKNCFTPDVISKLYQHNNVRTFFTKNSLEHVRVLFPADSPYYHNASHWILIEQYRQQLAQDVVAFLNH